MLPGPGPQPARTAEKTARQSNYSPEDQKHGKRRDRNLPIGVSAAWIAVHIGQDYQSEQCHARNHHTSAVRLEVMQQLLQTQEVPGSLGRIWCTIWIGWPLQRR